MADEKRYSMSMTVVLVGQHDDKKDMRTTHELFDLKEHQVVQVETLLVETMAKLNALGGAEAVPAPKARG